MADRIAVADGNLTTAATWALVDATSKLDSETGNTALTTAYVASQTSTPGAITIDGIAVKVASRAATPSGTMSVRLATGGALVAGTEVTINVSDLQARDNGWVFFKFAAPVTLLAATLYTVDAKTSVVSMVNLYRNATAGNWARLLRTTTTGAPAATDDLYILGEWTSAGVKDDRAVTMDSTAATDYGSGSTSLPGFCISNGGTLTWGTTAATNYVLRLSTILAIYLGGVMNMGTTGTPCPRDSSMQLEFDCAADGDFGLKVFGTFNAQGLSRTSGKNVVQCLLNTDEAAAQTVLGVDTDTGWLNGDDIAIAATTRTASEAETRTLSVDAGASSVTVSAGLTNAHSGTSPTQAEVILLTRNVRIQSVSTTAMAYVYFGVAAVVDIDWLAFRYLGTSTTGKRGVEIDTASGSVALNYVALRDFERHGIYAAAADWNNLTIADLTAYKVGHQSTGDAAIYLVTTTGTNWSLTNVTIISNNSSAGYGLRVENGKGDITNLRCSCGGGDGMLISLGLTGAIDGTWSGFNLHSHGDVGVDIGLASGVMQSVTAWRNTSAGVSLNGTYGRMVVQTGTIFGNGTQNILMDNFSGAGAWKRFLGRSLTLAGDSTFATTYGVRFSGNQNPHFVTLENCSLGSASGILVAHATADIDCQAQDRYAEIVLIDTLLASATEIQNSTRLRGRSFIAYQRADQSTGANRKEYPALGTVSYDAVLFRTAAPSEKIEPSASTAGQRIETGPKRVPVLSGNTVNIAAYVQVDASYDGSAPRLMLRANPALGIDTDTVIATFSAAAGVWQQLSGTTAAAAEDGVFEFYVDATGTAGQANVDDWSAS